MIDHYADLKETKEAESQFWEYVRAQKLIINESLEKIRNNPRRRLTNLIRRIPEKKVANRSQR